ncbi:MAG: hypothetical protein ACXWVA_06170, partial [Rhodoplanes sp.]
MRTIVSVQILRAVAASAVVLAHAQSWLSKMAGAPDALPDLHFGRLVRRRPVFRHFRLHHGLHLGADVRTARWTEELHAPPAGSHR